MVDSLATIFGETVAPALEKLRTDAPDRFQMDLNDFSSDEMDFVYDRLTTGIKDGITYDETDLTHFALLFGAKSLQSDFHEKEQVKITDIRDYFMLGMGRRRVHGDEGLTYHMGVWFHEMGEIMGYRWNNLPKHDFMLNAKTMGIYNQYTTKTYNSVVEQGEQMKKWMPSQEKIAKFSVDEKVQAIKDAFAKQPDFFTVPEPCYQSLSLREMLDYSLYLIVEGDVKTYLHNKSSSIQKFKDMLKSGESFNPLDLRAAWWVEEEQRRLNTPKDPNVIYIGEPVMDQSKSRKATLSQDL
jgi:hypothetical protein